MTYYYAQLTPANIVHTVCALSGPVVAANMIAIDSLDDSLLGLTYNAGTGLFE